MLIWRPRGTDRQCCVLGAAGQGAPFSNKAPKGQFTKFANRVSLFSTWTSTVPKEAVHPVGADRNGFSKS